MNRFIAIIVAVISLNALAIGAPIPALTARITDQTATLTIDQKSGLESRLADFEKQKGSQIAVLIVPSTLPETIEQYSIRVFDQWKLGRKSIDDGVLLIIAKNDRKLRIEVGYGLEGALPDATAKRIIEEVIAPHLKKGNYSGGIDAGISSIINVIKGESFTTPKKDGSTSWAVLFPILIFFMIIFAPISGFLLRKILGRVLGLVVNGVLVFIVIFLLAEEDLFVTCIFGFVAVVFDFGSTFAYKKNPFRSKLLFSKHVGKTDNNDYQYSRNQSVDDNISSSSREDFSGGGGRSGGGGGSGSF